MSEVHPKVAATVTDFFPEQWTAPPQHVSLDCDDVHVWYLRSLSSPSPAEFASLSPDERDAADRFRFEPGRIRYIACRSRLRSILAAYLGESPAKLQLARSQYGKPFLVADSHARIRFNVSHSGDSGLIAVALGREVGVDIEQFERALEIGEIVRQFFTTAEAEYVNRASADERRDAFFRCWTLKEAWMKATGVGLTEPVQRFDVSAPVASQGAMTVRDGVSGTTWTLQSLSPARSTVAAVAVQGSWKRLHCFVAE